MKTAILYPGQGAQFSGMGKDLFESSDMAKAMFAEADAILGFDISTIMFQGTDEQLKQTSVTQPAIYLHSVISARVLGLESEAQMTAGHSLGEFSALAFAGAISFQDGLKLVSIRANAMQKACDAQKSSMAAIVGLEDEIVENLCKETGLIVVPANYNSPGQLVISGSLEGIQKVIEMAKGAGARMATELQVNGAFHSPFMEPAREELAKGILETPFSNANIPVYQNVSAKPETHKDAIRENLVKQLTAPVRWTQSIQNMIADGGTNFLECGPGKVLQGLVKRIDKTVTTAKAEEVKKQA